MISLRSVRKLAQVSAADAWPESQREVKGTLETTNFQVTVELTFAQCQHFAMLPH